MKMLIVDGYNVIRSTHAYDDIATEDWDLARTALIADVAAFAQGEYQATIVFDGGGNPNSVGLPHAVAGIEVIFSPAGHDADSTIERLAREARERGDEALVVTSDADMQWTVVGGSVGRMSSAGFSREVRGVNEDWAEHNPAGSRKNPLADRLSPEIAQKLSRWARGLE